ncbi:MAG: excinuclease ABC subunit UvrC, partial [Actinobacteria bacterium]|nr:excinuclease ABC subunit UvrC [Actinomycetota bacterium]
AGQTGKFIRRLESRMRAAAAEEAYERAARLRDDIQALQRALEKQAVVLPDGTDCDVIALAEDQLEAAVQIFYVRGGRVRGQRGWVLDKVEDVSSAELVEHFLGQVYGDDPAADDSSRPGSAAAEDGAGRRGDSSRARISAIPREVLVPALPPEVATVEDWLGDKRGAKVSLRVPQRGDKKALLDTVARNAAETLVLHKTRRASDLTTRSRALGEIQEALGLDEAPLRIESYDVSNLQGEHVVASMVVFEDGLARKSEYRRFAIKGLDGTDDVAAIHEVITRRFRRYLEEKDAAPPGVDELAAGADADRRKFAYPPNLLVIDGGPSQVAAAVRALHELGVVDVAVCGLAKRLEEVWLPAEDGPVILPRTSEGLYLLQRVRDEAHRFAITYHRSRRAAALTASELDDVPGLGRARRATLLKKFGSVRKLRAASVDDIAAVPGFGKRTAQAVYQALHGDASPGGEGSTADGSTADYAQSVGAEHER